MVNVVPEQSSFNGGEWSPHVWGRQTNVDGYDNSCREVTNFDVLIQGPARYRSGFRYIRIEPDADLAAKESRLISFEFGDTQTYTIEFGDQYCRFYRDRTVLTEAAKTITAATKANPCVVTSASHGYSNGDEVFISDVAGMTELNNRFFKVANVTTNTFELVGIDSTNYTTYASGGSAYRVYTVASPYTEAQIWAIGFTQSADELYLVHQDVTPKKLVRNSDTSWSFTDADFKDGPFLDQNLTDTTLTAGGAGPGAGITLTASSVVGINNGTGFQTTDVGRQVRIKSGSNWGWGIITGRTSTTVVTVEIKQAVGTSATKDWRLGAFSTTTGYPAVAVFYSDRLTLLGVPSEPQGVFASKSSEYENFALSAIDGTVFANNALTLYLSSNTVNIPKWAVPIGRDLIVGTSATEWQIGANTSGEAFVATTATARETTTTGSASLGAVKVDGTALFVSKTQRSIGKIDYSFDRDNYGADTANLYGDHIMRGGVKQIAYVREPENRLLCVMKNGDMLTMSYKPNQNVQGWTRYRTNGKIKSVAVIPSVIDQRNDIYVIVERVVNGVKRKFTEVLDHPFDIEDTLDDANFLDCGIKYDGRSSPDADLTISAASGAVTITASASVFGSASADDDVRIGTALARITVVNSATEIEATILSDYTFPLSVESGEWTLLRRIDTLDRLWHLEGQLVSVTADGVPHPDRTVQSGTIQLDDKYHVVSLGYGYTGRLVTKMFNAGNNIGTAQGLIKRFSRVVLHFYNTLGGFIGGIDYNLKNVKNMTEIQYRSVNDRMDQPPPLRSGFFEEVWPVGYERDGSIVIEQRQPLPMTVIAVMPKLNTYEGR